jgi:hypothetical protein
LSKKSEDTTNTIVDIRSVAKNTKTPPTMLVINTVDFFIGSAFIKSTLSLLKTKLNKVVAITNGIKYIPIIVGIDILERLGKTFKPLPFLLIINIVKYVKIGTINKIKYITPLDFFKFSFK